MNTCWDLVSTVNLDFTVKNHFRDNYYEIRYSDISSLKEENTNDLERVQKTAVKIILGDKFENYDDALEKVYLQRLIERRNELCLKFAKKVYTK